MTKRLLAVVPAVLAGGALLLGLTACGQGSDATASGAATIQATTAAPKAADGGGDPTSRKTQPSAPQQPAGNSNDTGVNCGPVGSDSNNVTQSLIADDRPAGTVGCTEAFNVFDEYKKAPVDPSTGTMGATKLPSGWSCATIPDPNRKGIRVVNCYNGKEDGSGGVTGGLAFHTQPNP